LSRIVAIPHKLILNKGGEEQVLEFSDIEKAFDVAVPWILNGYIARVTDGQGVVKYTQALTNGQIATYLGDATVQAARSGSQTRGLPPAPRPRKPWWRFW
jgi:hypothetical protein